MEKILYTILGPHACMFDNIIHEPFAFSAQWFKTIADQDIFKLLYTNMTNLFVS